MWRVPARYLSSRAVIWRSAIVARWPSGGGARRKAGPSTPRPSISLNNPRVRSLAMCFFRIATRMKPGPSARVYQKIGFISSRALCIINNLDLFESWTNMWNCCSGIGPEIFDPGDCPAFFMDPYPSPKAPFHWRIASAGHCIHRQCPFRHTL